MRDHLLFEDVGDAKPIERRLKHQLGLVECEKAAHLYVE